MQIILPYWMQLQDVYANTNIEVALNMVLIYQEGIAYNVLLLSLDFHTYNGHKQVSILGDGFVFSATGRKRWRVNYFAESLRVCAR